MFHDNVSHGAVHALVLVPPLVRSVQPLLGPALLIGAATSEHVSASLVDLGQQWIHAQGIVLKPHVSEQVFVGHVQHPTETFGSCLNVLRREHMQAFTSAAAWSIDDRTLDLTYDFEAVVQAAERHARLHDRWIRGQLRAGCSRRQAPIVCWFQVDSELQVLWALAVAMVARKLWSTTTVIWSGALVVDLAEEIAADARYGQHIDGFVPHHPHAIIDRVIDELAAGRSLPPTVMRAGQGREQVSRSGRIVVPKFPPNLVIPGGRFAIPLRLVTMTEPRCRWCPVPQRGRRARVDMLHGAVTESLARNADLEFLDRGYDEDTLDMICRTIDARLRWSLRCDFQDDHAEALAAHLAHIVAAGCRTLYLSLHPHALAGPARARELPDALLTILRAARTLEVPLVIRRVHGFPGMHELGDLLIDRLLDQALRGYPVPVHRTVLPFRPRRSCFRSSGCTMPTGQGRRTQRWDLLRTAPWTGVVQPRRRSTGSHDENE